MGFRALFGPFFNAVESPSKGCEINYPISSRDMDSVRDVLWRCRGLVFKHKGELFAPSLVKVGHLYYAWVTVLGDPEKAKRFATKISVGEKGNRVVA